MFWKILGFRYQAAIKNTRLCSSNNNNTSVILHIIIITATIIIIRIKLNTSSTHKYIPTRCNAVECERTVCAKRFTHVPIYRSTQCSSPLRSFPFLPPSSFPFFCPSLPPHSFVAPNPSPLPSPRLNPGVPELCFTFFHTLLPPPNKNLPMQTRNTWKHLIHIAMEKKPFYYKVII